MDRILPTLPELIKKGGCTFTMFRAGFLYYNLVYTDWGENKIKNRTFQFTIPLEDTSGASFNVVEKPITLMRWIRKAYENKELIEIK